ncbi:MAG TPA: hypothetical protein DEG69_09090, partial [Flavobacteriaceae bacterium]|nr:hypothetical protein [Flavobacteriaceae bacterium]
SVNLQFTVSNYSGSGSISGYFYNKHGNGFTFPAAGTNHTPGFNTTINSNGKFSQNFTLGDSVTTDPAILRNTFVINVDNETFSATLDNFRLYTYVPDFKPTTVTYSEDVKGWTSFKSFIPEAGLSLSSNYYTIKNGELWKHHSNETRNWFYGILEDPDGVPGSGDEYPIIEPSTITTVLNTEPSLVKSFNTLNYEGSQSRVYVHAADTNTGLTNASLHNMKNKDGWYVSSIVTDKQNGFLKEFIEKEGKWFNYIKGNSSHAFAADRSNISKRTSQFSFQGLGIVSTVQDPNTSVAGGAVAGSPEGTGTGNGGGAGAGGYR